jgi:predicted DCC family thiol-disulfide oxidoreductase YuxK
LGRNYSEIANNIEQLPILFYDGQCQLCHNAVQFVLKYEKSKELYFCSLDDLGNLPYFNGAALPPLGSTVLLHHKGKLLAKAEAVIALCTYLKKPWSVLGSLLAVFPTFLLNFSYDLLAKTRYRIWGSANNCLLPAKEDLQRFLP